MLLLVGTLFAVALCVYVSQKEVEPSTTSQQSLIGEIPQKKSKSETIGVLRFGKGGGFTGASQDYSMSIDGNMNELKLRTNTSNALAAIESGSAQNYHARFDSIVNELGTFNKPGNMTYYIKKKKNDSDQVLVWGASEFSPDSTIVSLFNELMTTVAKQN